MLTKQEATLYSNIGINKLEEMLNKDGNESINESINEALKSDEKMILELIREDSRISQKIIVEKTEYSRSKVQRILKTLQKKEILYRQGSRKKGEWIIVEPKEMKL